MKLQIEFKNVRVTLTNERGDKFVQDIELKQEIFIPPGFDKPGTKVIITEEKNGNVRMFKRVLSPKKTPTQETESAIINNKKPAAR